MSGASRGINQIPSTAYVQNGWSAINTIVDQLCDLIPYSGTVNGFVTDTGGLVSITHGLGFTPTVVSVSLVRASGTVYTAAVQSISSTTILVRIMRGVSFAASQSFPAGNVLHWIAIK